MGRVTGVRGAALKVENARMLHNGDGLCFLNRQGAFEGFRVNRVDGDWVYPLEKRDVKPGALLYRNYDHSFEQQLQKKSAERRIPVDMRLYETPRGLALKITGRRRPFGCRCLSGREGGGPHSAGRKSGAAALPPGR